MLQRSFIAQAGQSVLDLALIAYGDSQEILKLAGENPGLDINAVSYNGVKINYTPPSNNNNKTKFGLTNIVPATASYIVAPTKDLLKEDGYYILLEDGTKIALE